MTENERTVSKKDSVRITATLTSEQYDILVDLAKKKKVSIARMIREAVDKLIENIEGGLRLPFDS